LPAALLSSALSERADHVALAHDGATLTFRQLAAAADRLAATLAVTPGERVAVVAPNVPALVVGLFAAWRADAVAVPLSARLRRFELERAFADCEPAAAVSVAAHAGFALAEQVEELAQCTPSVRVRVVVDDSGDVVHASPTRSRAPASPSDPEIAAILYTSGTTGEPRGALVPRALADAMAWNLAELLGEDAGAPYGLVPPASHAFGLGCLLCGIAAGATAVLVHVASNLGPLLEALRRQDARVLHGSPALFERLLRGDPELPVRSGLCAGSLCPPDVLRALDERGMRILNLYGMTEIGAATSCRSGDSPETRYRTVGRPLPGYEVRAVGGEIQVRSSYLPSGYHGRRWSDDEWADGDWFRTGDLGELDPAGNVTIAGRAKEVVHVGGFNVFPAEVESFLLTHPAIAQAAVIGVPHQALGEALQAFIVPACDTTLEPREVVRFARAGVAGYKVPYAVHVIDELPLLPSGKPDRRELARSTEREAALDR
jgi:acyl-CoA synthetase (AMP-forming)/AMP-acid ligase II